jgi:hypothetical protein
MSQNGFRQANLLRLRDDSLYVNRTGVESPMTRLPQEYCSAYEGRTIRTR